MNKLTSNFLYGAVVGIVIGLVISLSGLYRLPLYYLIPIAILFGLLCAFVAQLFRAKPRGSESGDTRSS